MSEEKIRKPLRSPNFVYDNIKIVVKFQKLDVFQVGMYKKIDTKKNKTQFAM